MTTRTRSPAPARANTNAGANPYGPPRGGRAPLALGALTLALGMAVLAGCDGQGRGDEAPASAGDGSLAVSLAGLAAGTTTGFQIDVTTPAGAPVASRLVATTPAASAFFVLPPGAYVVTATALDGPGLPTAGCTPATTPAEITKGRTTSIMLVARCGSGDGGGLDVTVGTNHAPEITSLALDPGTTVAPCAPPPC